MTLLYDNKNFVNRAGHNINIYITFRFMIMLRVIWDSGIRAKWDALSRILSVYVRAYVRTDACMYVCMHSTRMCVCMYVCMYAQCMYMYVHTCMYMYVHVCTCMYMYVHVCTCMYMYVCMYVCMYLCMYTVCIYVLCI